MKQEVAVKVVMSESHGVQAVSDRVEDHLVQKTFVFLGRSWKAVRGAL